MKRFIEAECRDQSVLFPERLDGWIAEDNPVRAVDAFVEELDMAALGFEGAEPAETGRPAYHPGTLLKIYIDGYLNRVQSSRRLGREAQRNVELMWLAGLIVAHDVVNRGHDRAQLASMGERAKEATGIEKLRVLADRGYFNGEEILKCEQADMMHLVPKPLTSNAKADGRFDKRDFVYNKRRNEYRCPAGQRAVYRFTGVEKGMTLHRYWSSACPRCPIRSACTPSHYRRIARWEHEEVLERMQKRLDRMPQAGILRRCTVEHTFGTLKAWMGATHFLTKTLPKVKTEISLHVLAYNLKRMIQMFGVPRLIAAIEG